MRATTFNMAGYRGQSRFRRTRRGDVRRHGVPDALHRPRFGARGTQGGNGMLFKRIAIIGSFALASLASAVVAADGGAREGRLRGAAELGETVPGLPV
ncbi:hypothetical protein [Burkholderia sp. BCC0322]|uniref:hypothetical protein n=1 Tax=unclassified Burkholderia TaxID=2613784 RepID=UPI00158876A6|nr:hypothetical protein [Burkholderia sp. BCC0322]